MTWEQWQKRDPMLVLEEKQAREARVSCKECQHYRTLLGREYCHRGRAKKGVMRRCDEFKRVGAQ